MKSSLQEIEDFERSYKIKLPDGYKDFAQQFGAGELAGRYRIAVPAFATTEYNLDQFNKETHGPKEDGRWTDFASAEVIPKLLFFAATIGGDKYAWDTSDFQDTLHNEYAIHYFARGWEGVVVANSFHDWIERVCLKQEEREDGSIPRLDFLPFAAN